MSIKIRSSTSAIESKCPEDKLKVENIYYDPDTKEVVIRTEEE